MELSYNSTTIHNMKHLGSLFASRSQRGRRVVAVWSQVYRNNGVIGSIYITYNGVRCQKKYIVFLTEVTLFHGYRGLSLHVIILSLWIQESYIRICDVTWSNQRWSLANCSQKF